MTLFTAVGGFSFPACLTPRTALVDLDLDDLDGLWTRIESLDLYLRHAKIGPEFSVRMGEGLVHDSG